MSLATFWSSAKVKAASAMSSMKSGLSGMGPDTKKTIGIIFGIAAILAASLINIYVGLALVFIVIMLLIVKSGHGGALRSFFIIVMVIIIVGILATYVLPNNWFGKSIKFVSDRWQDVKNLQFDPTAEWDKQQAVANGNYYEGQVEENQYTPLGVYLEDLKASDSEYVNGDKVSVWATLKVKTLTSSKDDKDIGIKVKCWIDNAKEPKNGGDLGFGPGGEKLFKVYKQADEFVSCKFPKVEIGGHSVYISAEYDFKTMSYIKAYFMDFDRKMALMRENIDVFNEYGITDTNPVAIFTNGPIMVGMATTENQPIAVLIDRKDELTRLGITIDNRGEGYIKKINDIQIQMPIGLHFNTESCSHEVKEADKSMCVDLCQSTANPDMCSKDCDRYRFYNVPGIAKERNIKTFQNFYCILGYDPNNADDLLGNGPISTRYIRAVVDYTYYIERYTPIYVRANEGTS